MIGEHALKAEAAALHGAIFGGDVPEEIACHYAAAHAHALTKVTDAEREWMARAVGTRSDLEALEIAVRAFRRNHVLTRKMTLFLYLVEAWPEYYHRFVNEEPRRASAFGALAWHGTRTMLKFFKGWLILTARRL